MQIRVNFRKNPPPCVQKLDKLAQNYYNLDNTNENPAEMKTMFTGRKPAAICARYDLRTAVFPYILCFPFRNGIDGFI